MESSSPVQVNHLRVGLRQLAMTLLHFTKLKLTLIMIIDTKVYHTNALGMPGG